LQHCCGLLWPADVCCCQQLQQLHHQPLHDQPVSNPAAICTAIKSVVHPRNHNVSSSTISCSIISRSAILHNRICAQQCIAVSHPSHLKQLHHQPLHDQPVSNPGGAHRRKKTDGQTHRRAAINDILRKHP
jgi:hypothetical protein